jgi:uncharacterized OsmC-like protein
MSDHLKKAIGALTDAVKSDPKSADAVFSATSTSDSPGFTIESGVRGFSVVLDEPKQLGGDDKGPNPAEAVLAALGSCQAIVYRAYAAALGLRLDRVQVEAKGELDLRGFLNLGPVRPGFGRVTYAVRIESPEPAEKIRELARVVDEHCPVLDIIRNPVEVSNRLEIVSTPHAQPQAA